MGRTVFALARSRLPRALIFAPRALTFAPRALTFAPRGLTSVLALALAVSALATPTVARAVTATTPTTTYVPADSSPPPATSAGGSSVPAVSGPATSLPGRGAAPVRPAPSARSSHGHLTAGAIVIAVLAALLTLACAAWAIARRRAYEPRWWLSLRLAVAEASFRTSATWAEFADWLRLGH
jgi:hypothetical protein